MGQSYKSPTAYLPVKALQAPQTTLSQQQNSHGKPQCHLPNHRSQSRHRTRSNLSLPRPSQHNRNSSSPGSFTSNLSIPPFSPNRPLIESHHGKTRLRITRRPPNRSDAPPRPRRHTPRRGNCKRRDLKGLLPRARSPNPLIKGAHRCECTWTSVSIPDCIPASSEE